MALTRTLAQLRNDVRKVCNVEGTTARERFPDADLNDYVNRGIAALYRLLTETTPDQRFLASSTVSTVAGTSTYALPADFETLISVDLTANGVKSWLSAYEPHERAALTDPSVTSSGVPFAYRIRAGNVELLPTPQSTYTAVLWYTPASGQPTLDATTVDTVARLDDYIVWYASRFVATKNKDWDLADRCTAFAAELRGDVEAMARSRDKNSPPRPVDVTQANRWGVRRLGR